MMMDNDSDILYTPPLETRTVTYFSQAQLAAAHAAGKAEGIAEERARCVVVPEEEWHEDIRPVLWWRFPVQEPPYCGTPLDCDWPGYHTHFTRLTIPPTPTPEGPNG